MPSSNPVPFDQLPPHWQTAFAFLTGCYPTAHRTWVELERGTRQQVEVFHRKARACRTSARKGMNWPFKLQSVMAGAHIRFRLLPIQDRDQWQLIAEVLPGS